jgi:hypothetical protein
LSAAGITILFAEFLVTGDSKGPALKDRPMSGAEFLEIVPVERVEIAGAPWQWDSLWSVGDEGRCASRLIASHPWQKLPAAELGDYDEGQPPLVCCSYRANDRAGRRSGG